MAVLPLVLPHFDEEPNYASFMNGLIHTLYQMTVYAVSYIDPEHIERLRKPLSKAKQSIEDHLDFVDQGRMEFYTSSLQAVAVDLMCVRREAAVDPKMSTLCQTMSKYGFSLMRQDQRTRYTQQIEAQKGQVSKRDLQPIIQGLRVMTSGDHTDHIRFYETHCRVLALDS